MFIVYDPLNIKDLTSNSGYNVSCWRGIGNSPNFPKTSSLPWARELYLKLIKAVVSELNLLSVFRGECRLLTFLIYALLALAEPNTTGNSLTGPVNDP